MRARDCSEWTLYLGYFIRGRRLDGSGQLGGRLRQPDPTRAASATAAPFRAWRGSQRTAAGRPTQAAMELPANDGGWKPAIQAENAAGGIVRPHPWGLSAPGA